MNEMIQLPGGYYQPGLSFREYRFMRRNLDDTLPVINASILKQETTIDMKAVVYPDMEAEEEAEGKLPFVQGDAVHKAILEPDVWDRRDELFIFAETAGLTTKSAKLARRENPDRIVIDRDGAVLDLAMKMRDAVFADRQARNWISPEGVQIYRELTGVCPDPDGQFVRKIRLDFVVGLDAETEAMGDYLLDVKTVDSAKFMPRKFRHQIVDYAYHVQAAYYLDTDSIIRTGSPDHPRSRFIILAVEKNYPYKVIVYELDPKRIQEGRDLYHERLAMLTYAIQTNEWQGLEYSAPYLI